MPQDPKKKPGPPTPGPKSWFGVPSLVGAMNKRKKMLDEAAGYGDKKKKKQ